MNQTMALVLISLCMGISTYVMLRLYMPWQDKHKNLFWLVTLGPMVLLSFLPLPPIVTYQFFYPFLFGMIASEFVRPKYSRWQQRMTMMAQGKQIKNKKKR